MFSINGKTHAKPLVSGCHKGGPSWPTKVSNHIEICQ